MDLPPEPNGRHNRWNLALPWGTCCRPNCHVRQNLLKCGACKAVSYCNTEHQRDHWPEHKSSCNIIKKARAKLDKEEAALRAHPGDMFTEANPLEAARGSLWLRTPARPYMTARFELVSALLNIKSGLAVEEALEHSLEMLELNRGDNQGVRGHVPALYLRLGRDQDAYDFIKWWGTIGAAGDYEFGNMESPYLNLHDQDIFEPVEGIAKELDDLNKIVSLTNIKVRLSLDIQALAKEFGKPERRNASYDEKMEFVREHAATDILYKRRDIVERSEWSDISESLRKQIEVLYKYVNNNNRHWWPALRSPDRYAAAPITIYTPGSRQEVNLVFRNTWYSWAECPAALELVRSMRA